MRFISFLLISSFLLVSCAGRPPFLEYSIAKVALKAARKVDSEKNAGPYWIKAMDYYSRGEKSFQERDYLSSKHYFNESIKWAEKAENLSRFKMSTGEGI